MSALTSSIAASWSGVSTKLNASSSSRCQVVSAENAWPREACRAAYSLISSAGDLADGLAGPALALGPVGAAHLVQGRVLAADVAGDLVQRVHRHVEPVARLAALGGGVLDHQVLPDRAGDAALHHLHVPADAVLVVHHRVAGGELQRVDRVLAPDRHLAGGLVGGALPGQVAGGEHGQLDRVGDEAVRQIAGDHGRHAAAAGASSSRVQDADRVLVLGQHLRHPVGMPLPSAVSTTRQSSRIALRDLGDRRLGLAAVGLAGVSGDRPRLDAWAGDRGSEVDDLAVVGPDGLAVIPCGWPSGPALNGDSVHQARPRARAAARTSASGWYDDAPRSIGA